MHPRWHTDRPAVPIARKLPGDRSPGDPSEDLFSEPLPDLEQQLAAELHGAAWAVVAFTSADTLWCDWVYRNLNGYPLPISLVDRVTPHGFPRPGCLSIFPDRLDPTYEDQLAHALEDGVYLIVVCSEDSAHSEAVDEQIRLFKKAGGEERIIALVVDGPPDPALGEGLRAPKCEWLPAWLRWRLEDEGFRSADRSEPRVVDARRGYRSLRQVRDSLLTALVDMDAGEFDRLGGCNRPVESVSLPPTDTAPSAPSMTTAVAIPQSEPVQRNGSRYTVTTAFVLILLAVIFGARSFREITADEPTSTLKVGPVTGVLAGHTTKAKAQDETAEPQNDPLVADVPPVPEAPVAPVALVAPPPEPVKLSAFIPKSNVPQLPPVVTVATSRIVPAGLAPTAAAEPIGESAPAATPSSNSPSNTESDAVVLDTVLTAEKHGDGLLAEKRFNEAFDLYNTALNSAEEYATRKTTSPVAKDQIFTIQKKLGMLQLQNSSTAEAKKTFMQARRTLLQLKAQGQWTRERAKSLDEIESRLLSLPRD